MTYINVTRHLIRQVFFDRIASFRVRKLSSPSSTDCVEGRQILRNYNRNCTAFIWRTNSLLRCDFVSTSNVCSLVELGKYNTGVRANANFKSKYRYKCSYFSSSGHERGRRVAELLCLTLSVRVFGTHTSLSESRVLRIKVCRCGSPWTFSDSERNAQALNKTHIRLANKH